MSAQGKIFRLIDFAVVAVIAVVFLLFFFATHRSDSTGYVEIWKDGRLVTVLKEYGEYELKDVERHVMDVVFENGKVYVKNSDCPLKICEKTGKVGPNGVIVCIPNKVVVKFVGKSKVDVMTW